MKISREIKAAFIVISSLLSIIWGFSYLKGDNLLTKNKSLFFYVANAEGLSSASVVTYNGLQIGKVKAIGFDYDKKTNLIEIAVENNIPISKTSIASIYEPSPIGGKNIAIIHDDSNTEMTVHKDFIASEIKLGMLSEFTNTLKPLEGKATDLLDNSNKMIVNINDILDEETKQNLKNSINSLNASLKDLNQTTKLINSMLSDNKENLTKTTDNLKTISANFSKVSDQLASANIEEAVNNLEKTLATVNNLMSDIQNGQGSMGKLMKDEKLYNNLEGVSREMELLLADFKQNPKRYVHFSIFGKKNEKYEGSSKQKDTIILTVD